MESSTSSLSDSVVGGSKTAGSIISEHLDVRVRNADLLCPEMEKEAIEHAIYGLEHFTQEKDIATYIKQHFDQKYRPNWHCIVGRHFGSYVTHEVNHFIYFYIGHFAFLLFKSG